MAHTSQAHGGQPAPAIDWVRTKLKENGLGLVLAALFIASLVGQMVSGLAAHNEELSEHGRAALTMGAYLTSGDFIEATFENWESEFLQMGLFVLLTVKLFQKGSSESKEIDKPHESEEPPEKHRSDPDAPWPVKRGGVALTLYKHSLSIAFFVLFAASFALHAVGGHDKHNDEALLHGQPTQTVLEYMGSSQFWFESFQNWQSEFLAVLSIVVLSIFLRERGSPQSKPVAAPHSETGA